MVMTRTQKSLRNFSTSILLQIFTVGLGFVSTPLLLQWLGDERFGAFRSAYDSMGYLQLLEFGLGGALLPLLARALGKGDHQSVHLTLVVGIRAYLKVAGLMFIAALALGTQILHFVPIQGPLSHELQIGYWIGLISLLWIPLSPFRLLSDASQRSDLVNLAFILQSLLINAAALYFAHLGVGIPGQFIAILLGTFTVTLLLSWQGLRHYPTVFSAIFQPSPQEASVIRKQLYQLSIPTLILNVSGQLALFTDNILIAYFLGPASVVPFIITQRLIGLAEAQIQGIGNSTWAALAELYARGELIQFNVRLLDLTKLVAITGLTFLIPIMVYNPEFVRLWVGAERFAGWGVSSIAALNAVLLGVLSLWGWCFSGTGNVSKIAPIIAVSSVTNVLIGLLTTPFLKMMGPLLGTTVSFLAIYLWGMLYHLKQEFGASRRALLSAIVRPSLLAICYIPAVIWFAQTYPPMGWMRLGISMALTAFLFLVLVWFTLLNSGERDRYGARLRRLSPLP